MNDTKDASDIFPDIGGVVFRRTDATQRPPDAKKALTDKLLDVLVTATRDFKNTDDYQGLVQHLEAAMDAVACLKPRVK